MTTFIIVDLEATCWKTGPLAAIQREESEVIEIGAVRVEGPGPWINRDFETQGLDGESIITTAGMTWRIVDEFQTFIKPVRHPVISSFCTELTTIVQEDVEDAPGFAEAWADLLAWVDNADDPEVFLGSWGRYDWNQLRKECWNVSVHNPWLDQTRHLNIKEAFTDWRRAHGHGKRRYGIGQAIQNLGIVFEGTAHRGIDDARNITKVFQYIQDPNNMSRAAKAVVQVLEAHKSDPITRKEVMVAMEEGLDAPPHVKAWWQQTLKELERLRLAECNSGRVSLRQ